MAGTDWSELLRNDGEVWYLDVTLAAVESDDWYDLKDITVTYTYQGLTGDELTRLDQVVRGIAELDRFETYHTLYLAEGNLVLAKAYEAFCAEAAHAVMNCYLAMGVAGIFGQAWGALADLVYGEYVRPKFDDI